MAPRFIKRFLGLDSRKNWGPHLRGAGLRPRTRGEPETEPEPPKERKGHVRPQAVIVERKLRGKR